MRQRAARRDSNEPEIVKVLREAGASVVQLDDTGLPDLLVGIGGINYLIEVKTTTGKLTPDQEKFFDAWKGQSAVIRTAEDAQRLVTPPAPQAVPTLQPLFSPTLFQQRKVIV